MPSRVIPKKRPVTEVSCEPVHDLVQNIRAVAGPTTRQGRGPRPYSGQRWAEESVAIVVETMIEARVIKCGPGNTQPGFDPRARCSTAFGVQGSWTVRTGGMLGGLGTRDPPPPPILSELAVYRWCRTSAWELSAVLAWCKRIGRGRLEESSDEKNSPPVAWCIWPFTHGDYGDNGAL